MARLKLDISYTPLRVENMSIKEVKRAYNKLRVVAGRRLASLERKGYTSYEVYKNAKRSLAGLPKTKTIGREEAKDLLIEVSAFLRKPFSLASTISKFENDQVSKFNKMGFAFINKKNLRRFHNYMNDLVDKYGSKAIQSFRAVKLFNQAERLNISVEDIKDNFYKWDEKLKQLEALNRDKLKHLKGKGARSSYVKSQLSIK